MHIFTSLVFSLLLLTSLNAKDTYTIENVTLKSAQKKYGSDAKKRLLELVEILNTLQDADDIKKLTTINDFFNTVEYNNDIKVWNKKDYWATRDEFLGIAVGDCEDYVIAKYFSLLQLGITEEKIFLTYVKAIKYKQSHMVLTYYKTKTSVPLILDNINTKILPSTKRKDLRPLFNFNGEKIYMAKQRGLGKEVPKGKINLKHWTNLILKIKREKI